MAVSSVPSDFSQSDQTETTVFDALWILWVYFEEVVWRRLKRKSRRSVPRWSLNLKTNKKSRICCIQSRSCTTDCYSDSQHETINYMTIRTCGYNLSLYSVFLYVTKLHILKANVDGNNGGVSSERWSWGRGVGVGVKTRPHSDDSIAQPIDYGSDWSGSYLGPAWWR